MGHAARTASDVTSIFSGGSASAPAAVPVTAAGDCAFCDGTFYTHIDATADASFRGVAGSVVLDGAGLDTVLTVRGSGVSVQVEDLSIESGLASALSSMGYLAGGGVACVSADEVTLLNVEVRNNEGETGSGLYVGDCDLYIDAGIIEDNVSDIAGGGIVAEGASSVLLTDSLVSANTSSWAGGMLVAGPGPVEIDGTLFDGNVAEQASAASFVDFSGATTSIACTGTATAPVGFINNMYDPTHGGSGAAVEFGDSSGALDLTASNCDFGTLAAGDINEGGALSHMAADWLLRFGDALSFTCTENGCGAQTTHTLADPTAIR